MDRLPALTPRRGLLLLALGAACTRYGYTPIAPPADASSDRSSSDGSPDRPRDGARDPVPLDRALDARGLDRSHDGSPPDLLKPDTLPSFSTTSCKLLWLEGPAVQLSTAGKPAGRPAIVTVGEEFYVVYGEAGTVYLHRVSPTSNAGRVAIGSSAGIAAPTVAVARAVGSELGVTWESGLTATAACPSALRFASFGVPCTGTTPPSSTQLTSSSCTQHGYSNPSLVHTGTQYGVTAVLHYACTVPHFKPLLHFFSAGVPASTCYGSPGGAETSATVLHRISSTRYAAAQLYRSTAAVSPFMITLHRNTSMTTWTAWEGITSTGAGALPVGLSLPGTSLTAHRPAIASLGDQSGDTVQLAWMASDETLRLHSCLWPALAVPTACVGTPAVFAPGNVSGTRKYAHPTLAVSTAHGPLLLLAYALDTKQLGITKLREGGTAPTSVLEQTIPRAMVPRYPTLAPHPRGFGLVWVEPSTNGTDQVFFKWIGCLPSTS